MNARILFAKQACALGLALTILALGPGFVAAVDPAWLTPIEGAYARMDAKLQNVSVKGRVFIKDDLVGKAPGQRKLLRTFEFSRAGDCLKIVRPQEVGSDREIYAAVNDSYFFMVHDNANGNARSLDDLSERAAFTLAGSRRRKALALIFEDSAWNLGFFGFPVESPFAVLKQNADHIRAQEIHEGDRKLLLLTGDFARFIDTTGLSQLDSEAVNLRSSRILLDPALDYRIVRCESKRINKGKEYSLTQTFEYDQSVDGYPVLSKTAFHSGTPTVGYSTYETELTDWRLNVNKPAEFRLPFYGIKEPNYGAKPFLSGWMWLLLIGTALVAVGGWLYRRASSRAQ